jgi:RES domain-containing protein
VIVYRIGKTEHIRDLSGIGASAHGGRWNPKGIGVIYTSQSRSLAALELYVNRTRAATLKGLSLATIIISETVTIKQIKVDDLPIGWNTYPAPAELARIGAQWVKSGETLVLAVPSAVMYQECNYLINPAHPEMAQVGMGNIEDYTFDQRFLS